MQTLLIILGLAAVVGFLWAWLDTKDPSSDKKAIEYKPDDGQPSKASRNVASELLGLTDELETAMNQAAFPSDILGIRSFTRCVNLLIDPAVPLKDVLNYCLGVNWAISCVASEALYQRKDSAKIHIAVIVQ